MNRKASAPFLVRVIVLFSMILSASAASWATTVATPTFSPVAGSYTGTQSVTISDTTSGATIYYTTDGSTPSSSSTHYTGAISVSTSETIKAIGEKSGDTNSSVASAAYTITVATPTFSPVAGSYTGTQSVTISDANSSAAIYYTTDGSTPSSSSTHYTGAISVSTSKTIKAIAEFSGATNSAIASAAYTITVATPTFSPAAGSYTGTQSVTLSDANTSATIYYTTNGNPPNSGSTQYVTGNPIQVSTSETIKAIAEFSGATNSATASAAYTITVPTPTFSPAAGTYTSPQSVTLSDANTSATIYYTTNGNPPNSGSTQYVTGNPIQVSTSETIKAIAEFSGATNSATASASYTINLTTATPTFSPGAGTYTSPQSVAISDTTSGAKIYYTTNGSNPTTSSTRYTTGNPITVSSTETVKAIATATGYAQSAMGSALYTINLTVANPTFSPAAGSYSDALPVTINDSTSGATIYYTTNGTTPTTSSTIYTGAITVSSTETVKALGTESGYAQSAAGSATYTLPAPTSTTTTLSVTAGGNPVTSVAQGTVVSLSAAVVSGGSAVTTGTVSFCNATAPTCTDINRIGSAQLTSAGTASINLKPGFGSQSYKAIFAGTSICLPSLSAAVALSVDLGPTTTTVGATLGYYPLTATVTYSGSGFTGPTGTVSFIDSTNGNTVLGTSALSSATSGMSISNPSNPAAGNSPVSAAVGDFNGDGIPDLAVADYGDGTVTVLLGNGDGTFTQASGSPITVGAAGGNSWTTAVVAGDFNGDGKTDIAAINSYDGTAVILLGHGDGTFADTSQGPINVGTSLRSLTVGDFNRDGRLDLAIAYYGSGSNGYVAVLLGNGDGTFSEAPALVVGQFPEGIVAGDFNGDGIPDLAITSLANNSVNVYLSNGDGTFTQANGSPIATGSDPVAIAAADFNLDGKLDLAITNFDDGTLSVLLGNGDGTFTAAQGSPLNAYSYPSAVAALDFNQDGKPDLAVGPKYFQGNGDGTFTVMLQMPTNMYSGNQLVSADFNGDGVPDIATTVGSPSEAIILDTILSESATATFSTAPPFGGTFNMKAIYSGDNNFGASTSGEMLVYATPTNAQITAVSPVSGPIGTTVTISGLGLGTSGTVTFNGVPASPVSWGIDTITVPVPPGATTGPVVVNSGLNSINFTVTPGVASISPAQGVAGTSVTILGTSFGSTQGNVLFNGVPAAISSWSNTSIVAVAPNGASSGNVTVLANGISGTGAVFTFLPSISSISPASGPVGTLVTVSGTSFRFPQGISSISFGSTIAIPVSWSENKIVVPVPAGAITGSVLVTVGGQPSNANLFTVSGTSPTSSGSISGTITKSDGVTPIAGATVDVLQGSVVSGAATTNPSGVYAVSNLNAGTYTVQASALGFGAQQQSSVSVVANQSTNINLSLSGQSTIAYFYDALGRLVAASDPVNGAATYKYDAVGNILGVARSTTGQVSILNFTPVYGPVGSTVTISGTSFSANSQQDSVSFAGTQATLTSASTGQLVVTVPSGAASGPISVIAPGGTSTSINSFTVATAPIGPAIASFSPSVGNSESTVTISGSGFDVAANDQVDFGGVPAIVNSATPTNIYATVPTNAVTGRISVATPLGVSTSNSDFFVVPPGYVASQVDFDEQMTIGGSPYSGTINNAGDVGIVVFNATAGQQFSLNLNGSTIASAIVSIWDPSGVEIASGTIGVGNAILDNLTASVAGSYTILVASAGPSDTGSLTFNLSQGSSGGTGTGSTSTGQVSVASPGQTASIYFIGTSGQLAGVLISNSTFAGCNSIAASILNPSGSNLISGNLCDQSSYFLGPVTLPSTGTYTVLFSPWNNGTGIANIEISQFTNQIIPLTPPYPGTEGTQVTIKAPGQSAGLTFSGTSGESASVQLINSTFPGCNSLLLSIVNPDGSTLTSGNMCGTGNFSLGPATLPMNGTYTVLLAPQSGGVGTTAINLTLQ